MNTKKRVFPGSPEPRGASVEKDGVNFSVYSAHAESIFLLLFDLPDKDPSDIIPLNRGESGVWHVFVHGIKPGQLYAYKVRGPYNPAQGHRFNEHKLLIDPYAKAVSGKPISGGNVLVGYDMTSPQKDLVMDTRDTTANVPRSIVIDDKFNWNGDKRPRIPLEETVIYELHVKGFTAHGSSGVKDPGTYLGVIDKIPYLKELGVTAVEFLPVQEFFVRDWLLERGLNEYWGYNTICFFAPESSYSTKRSMGCQVAEFKAMVKAFHKAGIEVILDVVYNHTGEAEEIGPTLCFRGFDNRSYYLLKGPAHEPFRAYVNDTGCGNVANIEHPEFLKLVLDSLRYWVKEMHVDGFRFDLATILGRKGGSFSGAAGFFTAVREDPILKYAKVIAEPWDLAAYKLGDFPSGWSEWNDKFRDTVRRFITGEPGNAEAMKLRMAGSPDIFDKNGRGAQASVNYVTAHDGFTLKDLVSYSRKYNEANREENRDGTWQNYSWNCGQEGETTDAGVLWLRKQLVLNAVTLELFSAGVPMLLGGDEFFRTQKGNNNAYCQDNPISWFDWGMVSEHADMSDFVKGAIEVRKRFDIFKNKRFPALSWFGIEGDNEGRCLAFYAESGYGPLQGKKTYICLAANSYGCDKAMRLPMGDKVLWHRLIDTGKDESNRVVLKLKSELDNRYEYILRSKSVVVFAGKAS